MRPRLQPRSAHARRAVLILSVCLLAGCAALFVASALLDLSADPAARHAAHDLRSAMPYLLLGGALFALLYFVIVKAAHQRAPETPASMVFGHSTSMQELPEDKPPR